MKIKNKTTKNKIALTKRIKVEHFNSRLFGTFKGLAEMKYTNIKRLNAFCKMITTIQLFEYFYEHTNINTLNLCNLIG